MNKKDLNEIKEIRQLLFDAVKARTEEENNLAKVWDKVNYILGREVKKNG